MINAHQFTIIDMLWIVFCVVCIHTIIYPHVWIKLNIALFSKFGSKAQEKARDPMALRVSSLIVLILAIWQLLQNFLGVQ
jgi:hypothetical protein